MYPSDVYESHMRHGTGNSLQVILKVAERCNIACTYCYFFFGGDESYKDNPPYIGEDTAQHFVRFVEEARREYNLERIRIILHGGEPLMLRKHRMRELLRGLTAAAGDSVLRLTVQTNAMLIDEEWLQIFEDFDVYVGVSLDGPADLNDRYRLDKAGKGTYDRVMAGVNLLFEAHAQGRIERPGLLSVINPEFPPARVYDHLIEEIGFRNIDLLLPDENHDSLDEESRAAFAEYVRELVRMYLREDRPDVRFRLVDKVLAVFSEAPFFHSVLHRFATQKEVTITVSSSGDVAPDDILRTADPALMKTGLNVATASLRDVLLNEQLNELQEQYYSLPSGCRECEWANVCGGGELYHRYSHGRGFDNPSVYCEVLKVLHEEVATAHIIAGHRTETLRKRLDSKPVELY